VNSTAVPQGWWNNDRRYPIPAEALPVPAVTNFSPSGWGYQALGNGNGPRYVITDGQGGAGQVPAGWWGMTQAGQMLGNWHPL
jgi:hypothetical protein